MLLENDGCPACLSLRPPVIVIRTICVAPRPAGRASPDKLSTLQLYPRLGPTATTRHAPLRLFSEYLLFMPTASPRIGLFFTTLPSRRRQPRAIRARRFVQTAGVPSNVRQLRQPHRQKNRPARPLVGSCRPVQIQRPAGGNPTVTVRRTTDQAATAW